MHRVVHHYKTENLHRCNIGVYKLIQACSSVSRNNRCFTNTSINISRGKCEENIFFCYNLHCYLRELYFESYVNVKKCLETLEINVRLSET